MSLTFPLILLKRFLTNSCLTMSRAGGGGRIRVTDDSFNTIGANVEVRGEHTSALNATKQKESATKTRNGHRNRLRILIDWWRSE